MNPQLKTDPKTDGYICHRCATKFNLKWPHYHVATWHYDTCDFCKEPDVGVCHTSDYKPQQIGKWD